MILPGNGDDSIEPCKYVNSIFVESSMIWRSSRWSGAVESRKLVSNYGFPPFLLE